MFFILSKLLSILINPVIWILCLAIIAWRTKDSNKKKRRWVYFAITVFILSNSVFYNEVRRIYEPKFKKHTTIKKHYKYGVVLSGMTGHNMEHNSAHLSKGADRLFQAGLLYGDGVYDRMIFTGGTSSLTKTTYSEAKFVGEFLRAVGMPSNDIIIEPDSRNTYENAKFSAALIDSLENGK